MNNAIKSNFPVMKYEKVMNQISQQQVGCDESNLIPNKDPPQLNSKSINTQKYEQSIKNQISHVEEYYQSNQSKIQEDQYDENYMLSSPRSNIFKSNENLFQELPTQRKTLNKNQEIGKQKQCYKNNKICNSFKLEDEELLSYYHQNKDLLNLNSTSRYSKRFQSQKVLQEENKQSENIQDDKMNQNQNDELSQQNNTQKNIFSQNNFEFLPSPNQESNSAVNQIKNFKFSLDSMVNSGLHTIESKNDDELQNQNEFEDLNQIQSNPQYQFQRKSGNTQINSLTNSKILLNSLGRQKRTEQGVPKQNNPNLPTNITSSQLSRFSQNQSKEMRDKQQSILERFQKKSIRYGSKDQRSESGKSSQIQESNQQQDEKKLKTWGVVDKLCILLKVKHKLKNMIKQRFSTLNSYERGLIGDLSDGKLISTKNINEYITLFQQMMSFTIHPGSFPIILFKIILIITCFLNLYYIPLVLGFDLEISNFGITLITISAVILIIEILVNFKMSLYEKGEIISDTKTIAKKYLQNGLMIDVVSVVGLLLGTVKSIFLLLMMFKIKNAQQHFSDLNNHYYLQEKFNKLWVLSRLFGFIFMMCHYFACIFHYVGIMQEDHPETWITAYNLEDSSWVIRYNYALYFSFITCMTIGYGDITPKNSFERTSVIIFSFVSTMSFSYSVNIIGNIFQDYFSKFKKQFIMRYNAINFMSNRQIHKDLQLRVLKYIEYIHDMENDSPEKGLSVINQISKNLQTQIFNDYYGKILMKEKNFSLNFSKQTIQKLTMKIKERLYGPGEVIFEQEEQDYRLFFLIKGECEFYQFNKGGSKPSESNTIYYYSVFVLLLIILFLRVILYQQEPKFFGYRGFISGIPREMSCRSTNISHDLLEILKEDPQDYEQFCKVRDQYLFNRNSLGESCFGCKRFGHTLIQCPEIHLIKNKELVIFRNSFTQNQKRKKQPRMRMKYSTLTNKRNVALAAQKNRLQSVIDLRRVQFQDENFNSEAILFSDTTDKKFSKMYPYIKFISNEMVLCDNYSFDELDEITDVSDEHISNDTFESSSSSSTCKTISEEDQDSSKDSENIKSDKKENNIAQQQNKQRQGSLTKNIQKMELNFINKQNKSTPEIDSQNYFQQVISDIYIDPDDYNSFEQNGENQNNDQDHKQHFHKSKRNRSKSQNMQSLNLSNSNDKNFNILQILKQPSKKVSSILKNKDEQEQKQDITPHTKSQQVRINSKTVVHNDSSNSSRKKSRNITDSPLFPRMKGKKYSEIQDQNLNQSPFQIMKGKQSLISKNDYLNVNISNQQKDDSISNFIKDEKIHQNDRNFQFLRQNSKKQKSSTFVESIQADNKISNQRTNDKEIDAHLKKDHPYFFDQQISQLQQIILNLTQRPQKNTNSLILQQKEKDIINQELSTAKQMITSQSRNVKYETTLGEQIQNPITTQQIQVDQQYELQQELFIFDFDILKEFTKYLPHNNASNVCQNVKIYQDKKKKLGKFIFSKFKDKGNMLNSSRILLQKAKQ